MTYAAQLRIAVAALACAAVAAPAALGAGEPKNQPPFVNHDAFGRYLAAHSAVDPAGEPKNQWPFTRNVSRETGATAQSGVTADTAGEPKNDTPFVRDVSRTPVLVQTRNRFDWGDAGIGAAAVLGLGCAALGAFALRAGLTRRPRATGT
jgi:hypothetical protein